MPDLKQATRAAIALLLMLSLIACGESDKRDAKSDDKQSLVVHEDYTPQAGDVIFQSSGHTELVDMIEGVSDSHYSHCGIVDRVDGEWVVYEASRQVKATPLETFLQRGRDEGYAVYRFKAAYEDEIPTILTKTRAYLGRPYDFRYQLDEEHIYCSELIYKAFEQTTGEALGELVRLGDMDWQPFEALIVKLENGPVPLDRMIITPIDLALAQQLEPVYANSFELADPR